MSDESTDETGETTGSAQGSAGETLSLFGMALWGPDGPPEEVPGRSDWWSMCLADHDHDDDCWDELSPIREPVAIPPPSMVISREEMRAIAMGYAPMGMDDKWLAFMEDDRLFLHRSWTGHGIYEVRFAAKETGFVATSARIESDPDRKRGDFDPESFDPVAERDELRDLIVHVSGEPMPPLLPTILSRVPALEAVLGDITDQDVDAIVNTANRHLADGDGINGAVHRAAGPELLRHCYREALACAVEVGAESVAFPAIATGARGYPLEAAATTAVDLVRSASTKVRTVRFVCFDRQTLHAFQSAIEDSA